MVRNQDIDCRNRTVREDAGHAIELTEIGEAGESVRDIAVARVAADLAQQRIEV